MSGLDISGFSFCPYCGAKMEFGGGVCCTRHKAMLEKVAFGRILGTVPTIRMLADIEKEAILDACRKITSAGGNLLEAGRYLGIGKTTLYRKLKEYGYSGTYFRLKARLPDNGDQVTG